jgi:hypothetical protein
MPTEGVLALGRVIERLLVCVFAGTSLAFGWNLFRVGVVAQQSAELATKDWRVNLKRVGPGVFFALFGSVVLAFALHSPLEITVSRLDPGVKPNQQETVLVNKYLDRVTVKTMDGIDVEYRNKGISAEEAYERLRKAVLDSANP